LSFTDTNAPYKRGEQPIREFDFEDRHVDALFRLAYVNCGDSRPFGNHKVAKVLSAGIASSAGGPAPFVKGEFSFLVRPEGHAASAARLERLKSVRRNAVFLSLRGTCLP
jgi:hypothetical protein